MPRWTCISMTTIGLLACNGEPTPPIQAEPVTFDAQAVAASVAMPASEAHGDALDAQLAIGALLSLLVADEDVQGLLNVDPTVEPPAVCWTNAPSPVGPTLNYTTCPSGVSGEASVRRTNAQQTVVVTTDTSFSYGDRRIDGAYGLTPIAEDQPLFTTSARTPAGQPADAVTVELGTRTVDLAVDGHVLLQSSNTSFRAWGVVTATSEAGEAELYLGGPDADAVAGSEAPADALVTPVLAPCRCPSAGTLAFPIDFGPATIELAVNQSLVDPAITWPPLPITLDTHLVGTVEIRPSGIECGAWTGTFLPDEPLVLGGDALRAAIQTACDNNGFPSEGACESMRLGAADVDSLPLEVPDRVWREAVEALADASIASGYCVNPLFEQ